MFLKLKIVIFLALLFVFHHLRVLRGKMAKTEETGFMLHNWFVSPCILKKCPYFCDSASPDYMSFQLGGQGE